MLYLRFSVFLLILNCVHLAPIEENSLFSIISNDSRAEQLKSLKFVKYECNKKNNLSESLCLALLDLSLKFNEAHLTFTSSKYDGSEEVCSKLINILPDKSSIDEVTLKSISRNISWIKDVIQQKEGKRCEEACMYESIDDDYKLKVKPVCFFIFNQYQFLASQSTTKTVVPKSGEETKSLEINGKTNIQPFEPLVTQETVKKVVPDVSESIVSAIPANSVVEPKVNEVQPQQVPPPAQQEPLAKLPEVSKELKKEEPPIAAVTPNKAETAPVKAETPKTESTSNVLDLDQQNLESSFDDKEIFNEETQSDLPDTNLDGENEEDDPDADYPPDLVRDNNRNMGNTNKFNHLPLTDVEPHENDQQSRVRVEKVLDEFEDNPDSNFFTYLCIVMFLSILLYILYHNRHKIMALFLEGRRGSRRPRERSRGGSKAAYSKLDCNLEEAITSKKSLSGKSMDIIY